MDNPRRLSPARVSSRRISPLCRQRTGHENRGHGRAAFVCHHPLLASRAMDTRSSKWVRLSIPSRFRMGPQRVAEQCGWRTRSDGDGLLVCLEERFRSSRPRLFQPVRLADQSNAWDESSYELLRSWPAQDEFRGEWAGMADQEVARRLASPPDRGVALRLAASVPDRARFRDSKARSAVLLGDRSRQLPGCLAMGSQRRFWLSLAVRPRPCAVRGSRDSRAARPDP